MWWFALLNILFYKMLSKAIALFLLFFCFIKNTKIKNTKVKKIALHFCVVFVFLVQK
jgi:hypothetical protein